MSTCLSCCLSTVSVEIVVWLHISLKCIVIAPCVILYLPSYILHNCYYIFHCYITTYFIEFVVIAPCVYLCIFTYIVNTQTNSIQWHPLHNIIAYLQPIKDCITKTHSCKPTCTTGLILLTLQPST